MRLRLTVAAFLLGLVIGPALVPPASAGSSYATVAALNAEITARKAADAALSARIAALESPAPTPTPTLAFDAECSSLSPAWSSLYGPGDPGDRLDTDFMGNLSQVSVANGLCTITAERKVTPSGRPYAAAAMTTKDQFSQLYGTFEARLRYPAGQGVWPAFWLLAQQALVATPPEVDVFEAYPGDPAKGGSGIDTYVGAIHTALNASRYAVGSKAGMTTDFHVWRIVWTATRLEWFLDGASVFAVTTDIPAVPMYPILTFGLGAPGYRVDATTPARLTMDVDWVRVGP